MTLPAQDIHRDNVRVIVADEGPNVVLLTGVLRQVDDRDWLAQLIGEWHEAAVAAECPEIVLDLRELEYANSAVWKCLTNWVRLIHRDQRAVYCLRIRARAGAHWQQLGLSALQLVGGPRVILQ